MTRPGSNGLMMQLSMCPVHRIYIKQSAMLQAVCDGGSASLCHVCRACLILVPKQDGCTCQRVCNGAQNFPNAVNEPKFPPCLLAPGGTYRTRTEWRFYNLPERSVA